mmetsp:Transcript_14292/g.39453  ORF Transcript_14292/g.39453 Transcript_14292/m.39453 type:complete len:270 (-) Transcript_14292:519-1328(-)
MPSVEPPGDHRITRLLAPQRVRGRRDLTTITKNKVPRAPNTRAAGLRSERSAFRPPARQSLPQFKILASKRPLARRLERYRPHATRRREREREDERESPCVRPRVRPRADKLLMPAAFRMSSSCFNSGGVTSKTLRAWLIARIGLDNKISTGSSSHCMHANTKSWLVFNASAAYTNEHGCIRTAMSIKSQSARSSSDTWLSGLSATGCPPRKADNAEITTLRSPRNGSSSSASKFPSRRTTARARSRSDLTEQGSLLNVRHKSSRRTSA